MLQLPQDPDNFDVRGATALTRASRGGHVPWGDRMNPRIRAFQVLGFIGFRGRIPCTTTIPIMVVCAIKPFQAHLGLGL